jgi:hypothetical protein
MSFLAQNIHVTVVTAGSLSLSQGLNRCGGFESRCSRHTVRVISAVSSAMVHSRSQICLLLFTIIEGETKGIQDLS